MCLLPAGAALVPAATAEPPPSSIVSAVLRNRFPHAAADAAVAAVAQLLEGPEAARGFVMCHHVDAALAVAAAEPEPSSVGADRAACCQSDSPFAADAAAVAASQLRSWLERHRGDARSADVGQLLRRCHAADVAAVPDLLVPRDQRPLLAGAREQLVGLLGPGAVEALEGTEHRMTATAVLKAARDQLPPEDSCDDLLLVASVVVLAKVDRHAELHKQAAVWQELLPGSLAEAASGLELQVGDTTTRVMDAAIAASCEAERVLRDVIGAEAAETTDQAVAFVHALKAAGLHGRLDGEAAAALLLAHPQGWALPAKLAVAAVIRHPRRFTAEWVMSDAAQVWRRVMSKFAGVRA
jgi:hypothetical protein